MKVWNKILLTCFVLVFNVNCATILKSREENVIFESKSVPVDVYINGLKKGQTPLKLSMKSNLAHRIELKKENEIVYGCNLLPKFNWGFLLANVIPTFMLIDAISGVCYDLERNRVVYEGQSITKDEQYFTLQFVLLNLEKGAYERMVYRKARSVAQLQNYMLEMVEEMGINGEESNLIAIIPENQEKNLMRLYRLMRQMAVFRFHLKEKVISEKQLPLQLTENEVYSLGKGWGVEKVIFIKLF